MAAWQQLQCGNFSHSLHVHVDAPLCKNLARHPPSGILAPQSEQAGKQQLSHRNRSRAALSFGRFFEFTLKAQGFRQFLFLHFVLRQLRHVLQFSGAHCGCLHYLQRVLRVAILLLAHALSSNAVLGNSSRQQSHLCKTSGTFLFKSEC